MSLETEYKKFYQRIESESLHNINIKFVGSYIKSMYSQKKLILF